MGIVQAIRVCEEQAYGPGCTIEKKECVGHVQKRMGTALRKLKDYGRRKLSDNKTIGGQGRLTGKKIDKIQRYYGLAIRRNKHDLTNMTKAVYAILQHMSSTDQNPQHNDCPEGPDSWCKFNQAKATGSTQDYKHTKPLPTAVTAELGPTIDRLSSPNLLTRCLDGYTQNACESFNSTVWSRCPKERFVGGDSIQLAVNDAVCNFNDGKKSLIHILRQLGVNLGSNSSGYLHSLDHRRVQASLKRQSEAEKKKRMAQRRRRIELEEKLIEKEGVSYETGGV